MRVPSSSCDVQGAYDFAWTSIPQSDAAPLAVDMSSFESEVIDLVNAERLSRGIFALAPNAALSNAARGHSADMAENDFFSHVGSDGSSFVQRIQEAGYTGICAGGENIAAAQTSPGAVVAAWMNSDGHRANILSTAFREIGVGYVYEPDDTYPEGWWGYKHYWTQVFGNRDCWGPTPTLPGDSQPTPTMTRTPTWTPSFTPTNTRQDAWTATPTPTETWTRQPALTSTPTWTCTATPTWTRQPAFTATPTDTETPTPTLTPTSRLTATPTATTQTTTYAVLHGTVELQGRVDKPDARWIVPLVVTLYHLDGTPYLAMPLYTSPYGDFMLGNLQPGIYSVRVKNPVTLANYKAVVALQPGLNLVDLGTLLAGDSSDDNVVDVLDFSLLRANFGTNSPDADYNGDGVVDVFDFSLLRSHFGMSGDIIVN